MNFNDIYDKINGLEFDFIYLKDIINQYENETHMIELKNENEELKKELEKLKNENEELRKNNIPNLNFNISNILNNENMNIYNNNQNILLYSLFKNRDSPMFIGKDYCFDSIKYNIPLNIKLDKNNNIISMLTCDNYFAQPNYAYHFEYDNKNRLIKQYFVSLSYTDAKKPININTCDYTYKDDNRILIKSKIYLYGRYYNKNTELKYCKYKIIELSSCSNQNPEYYFYYDTNEIIHIESLSKTYYNITDNNFKIIYKGFGSIANKIYFDTLNYIYTCVNIYLNGDVYKQKIFITSMEKEKEYINIYHNNQLSYIFNCNTLEYYTPAKVFKDVTNVITTRIREFYSKYPN